MEAEFTEASQVGSIAVFLHAKDNMYVHSQLICYENSVLGIRQQSSSSADG